MFAVPKRNIIVPGPDGVRLRLEKDVISPLPGWAEQSAYLKALAADGKVILSDGKKIKKPAKQAADEPGRSPGEA